ncbi:hypothetical protein DRQ53_08105, partial [bacterium]
MDEAARRNFQALSDGLKQQRETNADQDRSLNHIEQLVAAQAERIRKLEIQLAVLMGTAGSG